MRVLPRRPADLLSIGGFWAGGGIGGGQAEAIRVPLADGTLVEVPGIDAGTDEAVLAGLLTLSNVYGTGWHAARSHRRSRGHPKGYAAMDERTALKAMVRP